MFFKGKLHGKGGAFAQFAIHKYASLLQIYDRFHNGKAESRTSKFTGSVAGCLGETFKYIVELIFCYANTRVLYFKRYSSQLALFFEQLHIHFYLAFLGKLDGVTEQVYQHLV